MGDPAIGGIETDTEIPPRRDNAKAEDNEKARRETFRFSSQYSFFRLTVPFKWVIL
jgi:hypothetical protein